MIDQAGLLGEFLGRLRTAGWVALDTEADSLHAYPEKLCLLQLSIEGEDRLVDPLAGLDLGPLWEILRDRELILHGGDYDLRLLKQSQSFIPSRIFDTMTASRLVGCTEFGLTNLVKRYLDVTLEKGAQRADWAKRPLTRRMEDYARNDTRYLKPLSDALRSELKAKGRLGWHEEVCARLIRDSTREEVIDPETLWRIKGSSKLSRRAMAVLRELWHWREEEAIAGNTPPYFILSHEAVVDLSAAAAQGRSIDPLIPRRMRPRRRSGVQAAVARGMEVPEEGLPEPAMRFGRRPTEAERRRFGELQRRRDARAKELEIDPTLIASRAMLVALAEDRERNEARLMNWQRELL
jgi:ribonuclease D